MLMVYDTQIQVYKPISRNETTWNPWFYSKTSGQQVLESLNNNQKELAIRDQKDFKLATVKL